MKTVTFYSYKGGVGRSLALSNIAIRLSELKKKVCVLDFDLEAPGLQFKFDNYTKSNPIENGIVDYIDAFSSNKNVPERIKDYCIDLLPSNSFYEKIQLLPAGNIDDSTYWKKLSGIDWAAMFYKEESKGVQFFLDLKNKIETQLKPDFLLIDSRTGITDIAGITLKLLADEVVILAANNQENIFGSKKIINSLTNKNSSLLNKVPKITFVLTRLPFTDTPRDKEMESYTVGRRISELQTEFSLPDFKILVIHSDRRLEENERPLIGDDYETKSVSISNDYLKLFDEVTKGSLTPEELDLFRRKRSAEKEFNTGMKVTDTTKKIFHFSRAIELDNTKIDYFLNRGIAYQTIKEYDNAEIDYNKALQLDPDSKHTLIQLAWMYEQKQQFDKALFYSEKAIEKDKTDLNSLFNKALLFAKRKRYVESLEVFTYIIEKVPSASEISNVLNSRADTLRMLGEYSRAYQDIFRAIEAYPDTALYFATLAEIYASDGKINEFYLNLAIALSKGITGEMLSSAKDVYQRFINDERFLSLMAKYSIDVNEVLENE